MKGQIIKFLKEHSGYVSGEEVSRTLGITRAAVWKRINSLKKQGYQIEAAPSKGYKLLNQPDMPIPEEVRAVFQGDIIGKEIIFYKVTTSTNDRVMEIGRDAAEGTVVVADSQEHGRGRFGREWLSPPNANLYFTVLLKPPFPPKDASVITLMTAVSVVSAIRECSGLNAVIKWPNDIIIKGRKAGGILTEMKADMDRIEFIAVGIGINVNMPLSRFPAHLKHLATSLKADKKGAVNRVELLGNVLAKFEHWYKAVLNGRREDLIKEWVRLDSTIGKKVSVKISDRVISGIAEGVNNTGELILRLPSGVKEIVNAGEVTILKSKK